MLLIFQTILNQKPKNGYWQAKKLTDDTGDPIVYQASTTGPKYNHIKLSPIKVTWSMRPQCAKLNIHSLHKWASEGNFLRESYSHGVRNLVADIRLLSPIKN